MRYSDQIRHVSDRDWEEISSWYENRGLMPLQRSWYPKLGFIVEGIAAVWLTQTDSRIALIENVISNKKTDPKDREEALCALMNKANDEAQELGYTVLAGFSKNPKIELYAKSIGAVSFGHVALYGKEL